VVLMANSAVVERRARVQFEQVSPMSCGQNAVSPLGA
jgi:hypothetical protein